MGEAMSVEDHRVDLRPDLFERPYYRRYLPERQKTRHVRKGQGRLEPPHLDYRELREGEHHDGSVAPLTLRGDVGPGQVLHAGEVQRRSFDNARCELPLQPPSFGRWKIQVVKLFDPHVTT